MNTSTQAETAPKSPAQSSTQTAQTDLKPQYLAAVDLGSNSFHMVVARIEDGHLHILDRLKEMVRLGAGLDEQGQLSEAARQRAFACLARFGERVKALPRGSVAAVGTNTLRQSKNSRAFLRKAEKALGHPISIIAGREEARLIYLGVSHSLVDEDGKRFVMDIGGGSTELIIGEHFEPQQLESLTMGCVSISQRFFKQGDLSQSCWNAANTAAHLQLRPIKRHYRKIGWVSATGASGTIRAVAKVIARLDLAVLPYGITLDKLYQIRARMIAAGCVEDLELAGLKNDRKPVFAGGLAILIATFEALKIEIMQVSDGALREGLIYERLGRIQSEDTRVKTVISIQQRFQISQNHARRISTTAHRLFSHCQSAWGFTLDHAELLHWACSLHEIGLAISHSGYHKHSAYLLDHADLAGFSYQEQAWMSVLVRCHRKKISKKLLTHLPEEDQSTLLRLAVLLRLATVLHRSRRDEIAEIRHFDVEDNQVTLQFASGELQQRPLLLASLEKQTAYLKMVEIELHYA